MHTQLFVKGHAIAPATKKYILEQMAALEKYHNNILDAKVEIRRDTHHKKGLVYNVSATLRAGGCRLHASEAAETVTSGIDIVRDELQRQLRQMKERRLTKRRVGGRIRRLFKGFPLRKTK